MTDSWRSSLAVAAFSLCRPPRSSHTLTTLVMIGPFNLHSLVFSIHLSSCKEIGHESAQRACTWSRSVCSVCQYSLQAFRGLYPYPVHHPYDQYSMVDFDRPDTAAWPKFLSGVRGRCCILEPGDLLFVPQYWWAAVHRPSPAVARIGSSPEMYLDAMQRHVCRDIHERLQGQSRDSLVCDTGLFTPSSWRRTMQT